MDNEDYDVVDVVDMAERYLTIKRMEEALIKISCLLEEIPAPAKFLVASVLSRSGVEFPANRRRAITAAMGDDERP